jgi:ABC-type antimicrobial peptide transport system permease subunit
MEMKSAHTIAALSGGVILLYIAYLSLLSGITIMGVVAASTSLLVGGIGVAGIMSTAVVERIREIGVRMAIGATRRQILCQFLAEAVLISVIGGFAGLIMGLILGGLLDLVTGFPLIPTTTGVLVGLLVSKINRYRIFGSHSGGQIKT